MTERLPNPTPEVKKLSKHIGREAALALIEARGGNRVYIPAPARIGQSELPDIIGLDEARSLAVAYGPQWYFIPIAREWRVLLYRHRGMTYAEIARKTGTTETNVGRILRLQEMTNRQLSFFG